jgi:predicted DNA-binding transcriptional regulator YafY
VNNLINESHKLKQRILFEEIPSGQRYLTPIIEAMRDDLAIELTYQSFWRVKPETYEIEPYCVKIFKQRWYVVARAPHHNELRIYSLDRIKNLRITENHFGIPVGFSSERYFENAFGIIVEDNLEPCAVQIKVFGKQRQYFRTLPLHSSQKETEIAKEHSVFSYFLSPTFDFRMELLSQGGDVEVLSPDWFRNGIKAIVAQMNNLYQ